VELGKVREREESHCDYLIFIQQRNGFLILRFCFLGIAFCFLGIALLKDTTV